MHLIRLGGISLNQTPLDWDGNRDRIRSALSVARERALSIVCLPELCVSGYGCDDMFQSPGVLRASWQVLQEILPDTQGLIVSLGLPVRFESAVFDAVALVVDGTILGLVAKQHLAGEGIHYEPRWFQPWPQGRRGHLSIDDHQVPIGDLRFDCGGVRIGFEICEDAWVSDRTGAQLAARGVDVILNPSASHFAFGKDDIRRRFVQEGSRAFGAAYVYTNLLGNEAGRAIYDGGVIIASDGTIVAHGRRFSFTDMSIAESVIDVDALRVAQSKRSFVPSSENNSEECVVSQWAPTVLDEHNPMAIADARDTWEHGNTVKEEEFARAVALGLFDSLRKSGSKGFVVSISGGADSAAVACLVALSVQLSLQELSRDEVLLRLGIAHLVDEQDEHALMKQVLTCVYQSTVNSGSITRNAARKVAQCIGATFLEFNVEPMAEAYTSEVMKAIGRPLEWKSDDIALQNIQARARSPGIWMLANVKKALLLSTSNRSEAAVGYATMDGDTSGGLAPVAGIDKAFLRRWLIWLEKIGPEGVKSFSDLAHVNVQPPTAELRPAHFEQTDEADLMPYEVLDAIERYAIRDKQMPIEVWYQIQSIFPNYSHTQLSKWIEMFFELWSRNQWKRERYAPSFHLDDENLDPKTWCRFPILSGGFKREIKELKELVDSQKE